MKRDIEAKAFEIMKEYYPKFTLPDCDLPSCSWVESFMKRLNIVTMKESPMEKERSENATVGNVQYWFDLIGKELNMTKFDRRMIGNLDETMLSTKGKSLVCVKRGTRFALSPDIESKDHITILQLIINEGFTHVPLFIFSLKTVPPCVEEYVKSGRMMIGGQTKGWITQEIFEQYMETVIKMMPEHRRRCGLPSDAPFLLFCDSHSSRKDSEILKKAKNAFIEIVTFPSHCSHILQPLDVGVYGAFKKYYRAEMRRLSRVEIEHGEKEPSKAAVLRIKQIMAALEGLYHSCSPTQIKNSFKYSGLYPWSPEHVLRNPRIHPSEKITINDRKRKGFQMDGKVVTSDIFIQELKSYEDSKEKPKKQKNV
jgi:hypothetical protein